MTDTLVVEWRDWAAISQVPVSALALYPRGGVVAMAGMETTVRLTLADAPLSDAELDTTLSHASRRFLTERLRRTDEPTARERIQARLAMPSRRGDEFVAEFRDAASRAGIPLKPYETEGAVLPVGDFLVPLAQVVVPALSVVLVGWLQGRAGRKVHVKFGDTEIEARNPDDLQRILALIEEHKASASSRATDAKM